MVEKQDVDNLDMVAYTSGESQKEPFSTGIDDTSEDPTIVVGKPVTTAFVSDDIRIPTEKVGCLQVTSQLQELLNHFPPNSKEKAFEQIYQILQVLDAYLIDNLQQHRYCMSPDSEYISLIMYATKLEIYLCNFAAIWVVLSILLDTQSNELQYIKNLQQVVDDYYDKHPTEVMSRLEHQITDIMSAMYDSVTNDNFDSISDNTDRVSGVVDNDYDENDNDQMPYENDNDQMPYDNDNDQMPYEYDNDNDTATTEMKYDRNMTNDELKDVGTKDTVPYKRDDNMMTKVKWSIETSDIGNDFMREYDNMHKSMEDRQINDFYEAHRHIQSAMMGDTLVKTGQNRQCIDNVSDYDREHHRLDLGPNMLPGAQQHTTVESAAALKIQDKTEGKYNENMQDINGQYRNEMYKRAENMIPQLDGTFNVSDDNDSDLNSYLDLAGTNIIPYRMRGQKQRHDENERANTNKHLALKGYTKPNIKAKIQRQKVPDDEDIDIDKIVKGDKPKDDRNSATKTEKQYKEKEAKSLAPEKAKRIQIQKDMKDKEAKRLALERVQIEALIEKHRPHTPKTPDKVSTSGTGKNAKVDGREGTEKGKPQQKKTTKVSQMKKSCKKGEKAKNADKGNPDTLLGDPVANTATCIEKAKEKGQKDKIGIDDIGIFEFIFYGLPELPELEGIDEDRLRELQNAIQEQLHQRDEERRRNINKRVQEFKKTFDFVNSHLLKGVVTLAELTKTDNRQPIGKIKPTDKMVMMLSLFDGTKPAMSKQHYERFNLYINFQTKSGHLTDLVGEAIDLFEHMLDKTALVWFQMNRSKFKGLTMLKMMFLQRYNPWGKTKREQLQSWNILSFDPKNTDVDEHIDLINTLGDVVDQKEEAKMEKFIETMPTMIQTHLSVCKDWAVVKDTTKSLKHIICKCDPPAPTMPMMATGATVPGLYSHIAHSVDKEEGKIPQLFIGAKPIQTRGRGKPKGKPQEQRQNPPKAQDAEETYAYENPNNYYHNDNYNASSQSRGCRPFTRQGSN